MNRKAAALMAATGRLENGFTVWDDRPADETIEIDLGGHKVVAYSYGTGDEVLFCLNGGPGLPCDYLRDPHVPLADLGFRVVIHDQLGTVDHRALCRGGRGGAGGSRS
jgi:proline iminopeptidase